MKKFLLILGLCTVHALSCPKASLSPLDAKITLQDKTLKMQIFVQELAHKTDLPFLGPEKIEEYLLNNSDGISSQDFITKPQFKKIINNNLSTIKNILSLHDFKKDKFLNIFSKNKAEMDLLEKALTQRIKIYMFEYEKLSSAIETSKEKIKSMEFRKFEYLMHKEKFELIRDFIIKFKDFAQCVINNFSFEEKNPQKDVPQIIEDKTKMNFKKKKTTPEIITEENDMNFKENKKQFYLDLESGEDSLNSIYSNSHALKTKNIFIEKLLLAFNSFENGNVILNNLDEIERRNNLTFKKYNITFLSSENRDIIQNDDLINMKNILLDDVSKFNNFQHIEDYIENFISNSIKTKNLIINKIIFYSALHNEVKNMIIEKSPASYREESDEKKSLVNALTLLKNFFFDHYQKFQKAESYMEALLNQANNIINAISGITNDKEEKSIIKEEQGKGLDDAFMQSRALNLTEDNSADNRSEDLTSLSESQMDKKSSDKKSVNDEEKDMPEANQNFLALLEPDVDRVDASQSSVPLDQNSVPLDQKPVVTHALQPPPVHDQPENEEEDLSMYLQEGEEQPLLDSNFKPN